MNAFRDSQGAGAEESAPRSCVGEVYRIWSALVLGDVDDDAAAGEVEALGELCAPVGLFTAELAAAIRSGDRDREWWLFGELERLLRGVRLGFGPGVWQFDPVTGRPLSRYRVPGVAA